MLRPVWVAARVLPESLKDCKPNRKLGFTIFPSYDFQTLIGFRKNCKPNRKLGFTIFPSYDFQTLIGFRKNCKPNRKLGFTIFPSYDFQTLIGFRKNCKPNRNPTAHQNGQFFLPFLLIFCLKMDSLEIHYSLK